LQLCALSSSLAGAAPPCLRELRLSGRVRCSATFTISRQAAAGGRRARGISHTDPFRDVRRSKNIRRRLWRETMQPRWPSVRWHDDRRRAANGGRNGRRQSARPAFSEGDAKLERRPKHSAGDEVLQARHRFQDGHGLHQARGPRHGGHVACVRPTVGPCRSTLLRLPADSFLMCLRPTRPRQLQPHRRRRRRHGDDDAQGQVGDRVWRVRV
jgi:hypothetical protein